MKAKPVSDMYTQMGMAALLPGMQYALDQMQKIVDDFREQLATLQNGGGKKTIRIKDEKKSAYWANMTAEERSQEVKRRMTMRTKLHPRDPAHPNHQAWLTRVTRANRKRWNSMTPEQRQAQMSAAGRGRERAKGAS